MLHIHIQNPYSGEFERHQNPERIPAKLPPWNDRDVTTPVAFQRSIHLFWHKFSKKLISFIYRSTLSYDANHLLRFLCVCRQKVAVVRFSTEARNPKTSKLWKLRRPPEKYHSFLFVVEVLILIILIKHYSIYLTPSLVDNETSFVDVF